MKSDLEIENLSEKSMDESVVAESNKTDNTQKNSDRKELDSSTIETKNTDNPEIMPLNTKKLKNLKPETIMVLEIMDITSFTREIATKFDSNFIADKVGRWGKIYPIPSAQIKKDFRLSKKT